MSSPVGTLAATSAERPEGIGGLFRFLTLLTLAGLLGGVAWSTVQALLRPAIDGEAALAELLSGELPFGLTLSSAVRAPGGDRVVTFRREGDDGEGPVELLVIDYGDAGAVAGLFRKTEVPLGMKKAEWEKDPSKPWHGTVRLEDIGWGTWTARLKVERSFEAGGGWSDLAQVDLSRPEAPRVLFARWPREVEASESQLRRILAALRFEPVGETTTGTSTAR